MTHTVLLTGATGFIAKRIALDLLNAGHAVRGSVRSPARADEVRAAVAPHLTDPGALDRLSFVTLDLTKDEGWSDAMQGIDALVHTASPFPLVMPKDENDLIQPAVEGTLRALNAAQASGVTRVVLTSSVVAIEAKDKSGPFTEDDWSDTAHPKSTAYYKSKTLAERAAWDFVNQHPEMQLTTINPALVLGTPLDQHYGTSLGLVERLLSGSDPMLPDLGFAIVDVADVSAMHVAALDQPDSIGKRFIAASDSQSFPEIARHLKAQYPDRKIATRIAPRFVLQILGLFDPSIKTALPGLGSRPEFDTTRAQTILGVSFTPALDAVDQAAKFILAKG